MERAAARSWPSKTMLENGRVLIADVFFFMAARLPRTTGGGKPAGADCEKKSRREPALWRFESGTRLAQFCPGGLPMPPPIFFIISVCIMVCTLSYLVKPAGGSKLLAAGFVIEMFLNSIVPLLPCSVVTIFTGKFFRSVAFQTVDSCWLPSL